MLNLSRAILYGIAIALFGLLIQATPLHQLEADIGLEWLFKIRGPEKPPDEVVVVTIDRASSSALGLPNLPRKWPRDLHARLVERLNLAGARVIAFDIIFSEPRDLAGDQHFAEAIKASGNVILFDYLETRLSDGAHIEKHSPPIPLLRQAARATAPFALPKVPEKINQAWLYKTVSRTPTIPVVALQLFVEPELRERSSRFTERLNTLQQASPVQQIQRLRKQLNHDSSFLKTVTDAISGDNGHLSAWLAALQQRDGVFLNFYGPARTIHTITYSRALEWNDAKMHEAFADKAVFVGFSERLQPEQKDGFYTVFTDQAGLDVSGVEIMATTFANLLDNRPVRPASPGFRILWIIGFGLFSGTLLFLTPGWLVLLTGAVVSAVCLLLSAWLFITQLLWLPVTTPLLFQMPVALVAAMLWHYLLAKKQRGQLDGIIRQYLPSHIAETAFRKDATHARRKGEVTLAATMSTDAEAFTPLSERLSAVELHQRINRYFQLLLPCIDETGGEVADIKGDAVLALWHQDNESRRKQAACLTAIAIQQALETNPEAALPTRIGLHWGEIALGNVGNGGHYEFRAVGETINTTSRLETLNKKLGTRILASENLLEGCKGILCRPLGRFMLAGKSTAVGVCEIQGLLRSATDLQLQLNQQFAAAHQAWMRQDFAKAATLFAALTSTFGDSVSAFFQKQCRFLQDHPPDGDWQGVTFLQHK